MEVRYGRDPSLEGSGSSALEQGDRPGPRHRQNKSETDLREMLGFADRNRGSQQVIPSFLYMPFGDYTRLPHSADDGSFYE